jgi:dihydroorotate dehydrogenase
MAGAGITMMVSALHTHGIEHIGKVLADVTYWLEKREYASL